MNRLINKKTSFILLFTMYLFCTSSFSQAKNTEIKTQLNLVQLKCLDLTERHKDEIYFHVLVIDKQGQYHLTRIPPIRTEHWLIKKGDTISNVNLLEQKLKQGESVTVIISLMESDLSKLNPDDLIGSAKVTLSNKDNHIEAVWGIPSTQYHPQTHMEKQKEHYLYHMSGEGGYYKLIFEVIAIG